MPAYKEKFINEITRDDRNVSISGLIINREDNLIFVDDGTGVIAVNIESQVPINSFVKVFGYLLHNNDEVQLQANIIQDLSNVNKGAYNKLKKLLNQK